MGHIHASEKKGKKVVREKGHQEGVKKSIQSVILSATKNLQLFVFKKLTADASLLLSMTAYFFTSSRYRLFCPGFLCACFEPRTLIQAASTALDDD
jgi:hypothetical protein